MTKSPDIDRRACVAAVMGAPLAGIAPARAQPAAIRASTFVLVHGAWFGGWCWRPVADLLRARGHRVLVANLTGLGDRSHLAGPAVTLTTHVTDVCDLLETEELSDVVLVAHSYGGVPCALVADRMPDRIRRLLFLDAVLPEDGRPLSALSPAGVWQARVAAAQATPANGFPPPPIAAFGVVDPAQAAWLQRRLRPQPIGSYIEAPKLSHPIGAGLNVTYVSCESPAMAAIDPFRAAARSHADWRFEAISASHACMVTDPDLTATTLSRAAD